MSGVRKTNSLFGRWLEKSKVTEASDKQDDLFGETVIERDTVVSVKMTVGKRQDQCEGISSSTA